MKQMDLNAGKTNPPEPDGVNGTCFPEDALRSFLSRLQSALKWPRDSSLSYNAWREEWRDVVEFSVILATGTPIKFIRATTRRQPGDTLHVSELDTQAFGQFHFTEVVHSLATFAKDCDFFVITLLPECKDIKAGGGEPIGFYQCSDGSWEMMFTGDQDE